MDIDWELTADMAVEELRGAAEKAAFMIRARCDDIAVLQAKNRELKALVGELEAENAALRKEGGLSPADREHYEYLKRQALERAALEQEQVQVVGSRNRLRGWGQIWPVEDDYYERYSERHLRRMEEAVRRVQMAEVEALERTPRSLRPLLPGQPGYVDPFWPKERAAEWSK